MIFYFTATGNSKYIAERIAVGTDDRIINIADCVQNEMFSFELAESEKLGFIVPVYFFGIPIIVTEFLQKLSISARHDYYSYAVLNCGGTTANAQQLLQREFSVKATFGIVTVDNYVPMYKVVSKESIKERLDKADIEIGNVIEHINKKDSEAFNTARGHFPRLLTTVAYPIYKNGRKTGRFTVNKDCTGCGLCEKVCPRRVIQIKDGKHIWAVPQCELCFACLHRCPSAAINYGKNSAKNGRYLNPYVHI